MSTDTINKRLSIISDLQDEINKIKAIYEEDLEENPAQQEIEEAQAKVKEEIREKKAQIKNDPKLNEYMLQLKELRAELKDQKEVLSQELVDHYKESGKMEITDNTGNVKRIKFSAKLINS